MGEKQIYNRLFNITVNTDESIKTRIIGNPKVVDGFMKEYGYEKYFDIGKIKSIIINEHEIFLDD